MNRKVTKEKMFNKKDEVKKIKKQELSKLKAIIDYQNKDIQEHDIHLDKEKRRLNDRQLLKKQQEITMQLKQDFNKVSIDINIAESKIKDLEGLRQMTLNQIRDILAEKKRIDKDNNELDLKIQGKGMTEQQAKQKQFDAEQEQLKKIKNNLNIQKEQATKLMERLAVEETKGKDMLDDKVQLS